MTLARLFVEDAGDWLGVDVLIVTGRAKNGGLRTIRLDQGAEDHPDEQWFEIRAYDEFMHDAARTDTHGEPPWAASTTWRRSAFQPPVVTEGREQSFVDPGETIGSTIVHTVSEDVAERALAYAVRFVVQGRSRRAPQHSSWSASPVVAKEGGVPVQSPVGTLLDAFTRALERGREGG